MLLARANSQANALNKLSGKTVQAVAQTQ